MTNSTPGSGSSKKLVDWAKPSRGMWAYGSTNVVDFRDYQAAVDEIRRLHAIAGRIRDARERDHWNDLDDAADDLLDGAAPETPERSPWEETAAQFCRNMEYYRGLVDRIGRAIGPEAYVADDGSVSEDVLRAKVPEIIERLLETNALKANEGQQ